MHRFLTAVFILSSRFCRNETRGWAEGEVTYFDDSFEHEVNKPGGAVTVCCDCVL